MPGEVSGLQPPAPVLRGGSRIAAVSSPRRAQKSTSRRARHAPYAYIMNPQNLSPPSAPTGEALPALSPQPEKFAPSVVLALACTRTCLHSDLFRVFRVFRVFHGGPVGDRWTKCMAFDSSAIGALAGNSNNLQNEVMIPSSSALPYARAGTGQPCLRPGPRALTPPGAGTVARSRHGVPRRRSNWREFPTGT